MFTNKNVLIAEPNSILRLGLRQLITRFEFSQVYESTDSVGLMNQLEKYDFTHLILGFQMIMNSPIEFLQRIRERYPDIVILLFTSSNMFNYQRLVNDNLLHFYLDKDTSLSELKYKLKDFSETCIQSIASPLRPLQLPIHNPYGNLSDRQSLVLEYLMEGLSTREISQRMNIKDNTVSTMKSILFSKLNVSSLVDLIHFTKQHQIY